MSSPIDVANYALDTIGISESISDFSDRTTTARVCSRWFDQCREEVLRDFPWPFAKRVMPLAVVADQTAPGWTFVYQYPTDAVRIIAVGEEYGLGGMQVGVGGIRYSPFYDGYSGSTYRAPWEVRLNDDNASRVIVCSMQNAWVEYVSKVENVGVWPPDAIAALYLRLAAAIGGPLKADANLVRGAQQTYEFMRARAAANSQNEARNQGPPESVSISARY